MRRRNRTYWKRLVAALEESGLTHQRFADERGVEVATLRSWLYRFRREEAPSLLPVRVVASTAPSARPVETAAAAVEAELPSGLRLRIPVGTDVEYVIDLLRRLA